MKCPECGNELRDGVIFCPVCGYELSIVPDFEPEIEISIEESLQGVADELSDGTDSDDHAMAQESSDDTTVSSKENMPAALKVRPSLIYVIALGAFFTGLLVFLGIMIYRDNSGDYQVRRGDALYDQGSYRQAAEYYRKAVEIDPSDIDYRMALADCYVQMENIDMAVEVYRDMIIYAPDSTLAYAQVISLYEGIGAYDSIDDFLQHYANDDIREAFIDYLAYPPVFSQESGSYDEAVILTLTNESAGTIYYTDDGSEPDEASNIYTGPIYLKKGKHIIRAFFKNEYGVCSSIVTYEYDIRAEAPSEPVVSLESGEYDKPQLIRIIVPTDCNVYYTLDDTEPDRYSRIYGEPIPVSDGVTHFKCVAINSNNVMSDVVEREYRVSIVTSFTPEMGLEWLKAHLTSIGYIGDTAGNTEYYPGRFNYMYSEMRYIGGRSLYCYNEYYTVGTFARSMTNNIFGIDCVTGEIFLVKKGNNDSYSISPF